MHSNSWHIITSEYPPQLGGVSDYTRLVASELARAGDEVHVWCPPSEVPAGCHTGAVDDSPVQVHRQLGRIGFADLHRAGKSLDQLAQPRRLLVQWVPHGYGFRSMNLCFCAWLWWRAKLKHDQVELMVHEPYLAFDEGSAKQKGVAAVHRLMTMILLNAARRVWLSIPAWERRLRPFALGRSLTFDWLPVSSNIPVVQDEEGARLVRLRYAKQDEQVVGHFGTYDRNIRELLLAAIPSLLQRCQSCVMLLLGRGGDELREQLLRRDPELSGRLHATGLLAEKDLSLHLRACDLMLQPYSDGVSSRRTSIMVGLSHGLAILTTTGRLTEGLWAESGAVALTPLGSLSEWPGVAAALLADAQARSLLGEKARALYQERFAIAHTVRVLRAG